jgi:hypothetical protein
MDSRPVVSEVRFYCADKTQRGSGLLGWATFLLDGRLRVEGIAIRRTAGGRLALAFPFRDDGYGKRWCYLRPINDETRVAIEEQVLGQLDLDREIAR